MTGDALRAHRVSHWLSQRELAEAWGTTRNTIARWERNEHPIPKWVEMLVRREMAADRAEKTNLIR